MILKGSISMTANARLITCSIPVNDLTRAQGFYGALLGVELAQGLNAHVHSLHAVVSAGVKLSVNARQNAEEKPMCHFAVENLTAMVQLLERQGGKQVAGPFDITVATVARDRLAEAYRAAGGKAAFQPSLGTGAIIADPEGNLVGLVELNAYAEEAFSRGALTEADFRDQDIAVQIGRLMPAHRTP
jgi:predicted enzyme related to lactoylglutathione lyase